MATCNVKKVNLHYCYEGKGYCHEGKGYCYDGKRNKKKKGLVLVVLFKTFIN